MSLSLPGKALRNEAETACSDILYANRCDGLFEVEISRERNHILLGEEYKKSGWMPYESINSESMPRFHEDEFGLD